MIVYLGCYTDAVDTKDADMFYVKRGYCVSNMVDGQGGT